MGGSRNIRNRRAKERRATGNPTNLYGGLGVSIGDIRQPYRRRDDTARDDDVAARVAAAKAEARRRATAADDKDPDHE